MKAFRVNEAPALPERDSVYFVPEAETPNTVRQFVVGNDAVLRKVVSDTDGDLDDAPDMTLHFENALL